MLVFSEDILDFPGFPCFANTGGFPSFGHATFNAEVYGDASCKDTFLGYRNVNASRGSFNPGANLWVGDDIELGSPGCQMISYEIGMREVGFYTMELHRDAGGVPGAVIDGTRNFLINNDSGFRSYCVSFSEPISLDSRVWMTVRVGNEIGGWVLTKKDASWGDTTTVYAISDSDTGPWDVIIDANFFGGFYTTIHCAGEAEVGACCDMFVTDEQGDAVCRDVPEINCAFPPRGSTLRPSWEPGKSCRVCSHGTNKDLSCSDIADCLGSFCFGGNNVDSPCTTNEDCSSGDGVCTIATCDDSDPFVVACGSSACCKPVGAINPFCENLTENECEAVEPVENPRQWQRGRLCGSQGQRCPNPACLAREGDCLNPGLWQCDGGSLDGEFCGFSDDFCQGFCNRNNMTCVGGSNVDQPCTNDTNCPNSACRGFCEAGPPEKLGNRCFANTTCRDDVEEDGILYTWSNESSAGALL